MILKDRISILAKLGKYMCSNEQAWLDAKQKAYYVNGWFTPEFVDLAAKNIGEKFLDEEGLWRWVKEYIVPDQQPKAKTVGVVMAGNIPLVGFHDLLAVFISGHAGHLKLSAKDEVLTQHLFSVLTSFDPAVSSVIQFRARLNNCDAYIATGSNNTARYFEYYFGKYPHIIRKNRTSVAVLTNEETETDLEKLADDVYQFFGLGCRNVTKLFVPVGYNFELLLRVFRKYNYLADHHKYKNNYDYNLAIHILNNKFYMTNESILLIEDKAIFSPISQINYEYYDDRNSVLNTLSHHVEVQCIVGADGIPFGAAQSPGLRDYPDSVDSMLFLQTL